MGEHVGIDAFGALIDDFSDVLIGMGGELRFAFFQPSFDVFALKAEHTANEVVVVRSSI